MKDRDLRVQFRLTKKEWTSYVPLVRTKHHGTWPTLVRVALAEYLERNPTAPSDNDVRQPANETETSPLFTTTKKKAKREAVPRRKKTTV